MLNTNSTENISKRLKEILVGQLKYPLESERIREDTPLFGNGLGMSSLDIVSLIVKVEEEFEIFFQANEISSNLETFGSLLTVVREKLQ